MATTERTYSFRAPPDLAERVSAARELLATSGTDEGCHEEVARELELALARRMRGAPALARDQSAFMRTAVELLVGASEKVAADRALAERYADWDAEDNEGASVRRGALSASTSLWRDG